MREAAINTLDSGRWVKGPQGRAFAEEFASIVVLNSHLHATAVLAPSSLRSVFLESALVTK